MAWHFPWEIWGLHSERLFVILKFCLFNLFTIIWPFPYYSYYFPFCVGYGRWERQIWSWMWLVVIRCMHVWNVVWWNTFLCRVLGRNLWQNYEPSGEYAKVDLPHKVKMQYVHIILHANYFLLPLKIFEEINRGSMLFSN